MISWEATAFTVSSINSKYYIQDGFIFLLWYIFVASRITIPDMEVHRNENGNSILNKKQMSVNDEHSPDGIQYN